MSPQLTNHIPNGIDGSKLTTLLLSWMSVAYIESGEAWLGIVVPPYSQGEAME